MTVLDLLGARIKKIRLEKGLSQEELAHLCNTNAAHIGRIERSENNTSLEVVCRIAEGLGITIKALLDFENEPQLPTYDEHTMKAIAYMQSQPDETKEQIVEIIKTFCKKR